MKYVVLSPVEHDGKRYEAGEALPEMNEKQLQALIDAGVLETKDGKDVPSKEEKETPKEVLEAEKPKPNASKTVLLDYAKANEFEVDKTLSRDEIFRLLQENHLA